MMPHSENLSAPMNQSRMRPPLSVILLAGILLLVLAGCQPIGSAAPSAIAPEPASASNPAPSPQPTLRPEEVVPPLPASAADVVTPARLAIPAIQLDVPVTPMGWAVSGNGQDVEWVLPTDAAGWHVNSAPAGGPGNQVISGSQFEGSAVFAPLALGDAAVGQEVIITDSAGVTFTYQITQVLEPLPLSGSGADATARALVEQAGATRLTLISGWPAFTTTHRQFVVAELVGE